MARSGRRRAAVIVCAVGAAAAANDHPARASELRDTVERVAEAWRRVGAVVVVDKTRFLNDDQTIVVVPPPAPEASCTTVALVAARGLGFHARTTDRSGDEARVSSEAGALSIERCGEAPPRRLVLTSDSGRGAVETILARSARPVPALRSVIPERAGGAVLAASEPGALPPLPSPDKRAEIAEARAKRDGAAIATRKTWQAGVDGTGAGEETLQPGCHTLQLFAPDLRLAHPSRLARLDLDAEMREKQGDRLLARDRTDAPDAQLPVCVGETTQVGVVFAGSPPGASVLVSHFAWSLPAHLPTIWGSEARARMAHVLLARHAVSLPGEPVVLAQGGSGMTPVPLPIEPGACYVAVATLVQGAARTVGLRVQVGPHEAFDDRGIDDEGTAVAFCAGDQSHALARVEARGTPLLGWGLALYRLQAGIWEVER